MAFDIKKMMRRDYIPQVLVFLLALVSYAAAVHTIDKLPRVNRKDTINVAIPPLVQTLLAGGDRYLAANIAVFRALVVSTGDLKRKDYQTLAKVQLDAARMNPAHEDNYYIAQAILPWEGEVKADLYIQKAATDARPWDFLPPFFLGFDQYYFLKDPVAGAKTVEIAAERTVENKQALLKMAAKWYEQGDDPNVAINLISAMAKSTRDKDMKQLLENRIKRLQGLAELRDAGKKYVDQVGRPPTKLEDLVSIGVLGALPIDPQGIGYALDAKGVPILAKPPLN